MTKTITCSLLRTHLKWKAMKRLKVERKRMGKDITYKYEQKEGKHRLWTLDKVHFKQMASRGILHKDKRFNSPGR